MTANHRVHFQAAGHQPITCRDQGGLLLFPRAGVDSRATLRYATQPSAVLWSALLAATTSTDWTNGPTSRRQSLCLSFLDFGSCTCTPEGTLSASSAVFLERAGAVTCSAEKAFVVPHFTY